MPNSGFEVWNEEVAVLPQGAENGRPVDLLVSDPQNNTFDHPSLSLTIQYEDLIPFQGQFRISAVVEAQEAQSGRWRRIAHQNDGLFRGDIGPTREIVLQPDLLVIDAGIDELVYVADEEISHISRHQGRMPSSSSWRIRVILNDYGIGTEHEFKSVKISAFGETY